MKTSILCIALLLGSVSSPLFAQKNASESSDGSNSTVYPFASAYQGLLQPSTLEVRLSKGNVLLLVSRDYRQSRLVQRPDSLVRLFWNEYGEVLEQLPDNADGASVHYVLDREDDPYVLWRKYPPKVSEYAVLDKELVRVKSVQDTLQVTVRGGDKDAAELFLIVNDLRDLPMLFDEIRIKSAFLRETLEENTKMRKLERAPRVFASYRGDRNFRSDIGINRLEVSLYTSLGYVRGNWATAYSTDLTYQKEGARFGPRLGMTTQQFFGKSDEGKTTVNEQFFLTAGITEFSRSKVDGVKSTSAVQLNHATLGYLLEREGAYYLPNTWRVAIGFNITPRIVAETEWYFNGFLREINYGLRLAVGIF